MERLKKVASSSSRVIANLQQAASGTFQNAAAAAAATTAPSASSSPSTNNQYQDYTQAQFQQQQQQQQIHSANNPTTNLMPSAVSGSAPAVQVADPAQVADADAGAQTIASQASAHLTDEERQILLEVFRRQEQFRLEHMKNNPSNPGDLAKCGPSQSRSSNTPSSRFPMHYQQQQQLQYQQQASSNNINNTARAPYSQSPARPASSLGASTSTSTTSASINSCSYSTSASASAGNSAAHPQSAGYDIQQLRHQCPSTISSSSISSTITTHHQARPSSVTSHLSHHPNYSGTNSSTNVSQQHNQMGPCTPANSLITQAAAAAAAASGTPAPSANPGIASATPTAGSQCPICWKLILEREELTHLCSNCNKFICDDCASYSTNEQDWMCSSCRRRATKQAVPADSLRDLGIDPSDSMMSVGGGIAGSMQRRMTLRPSINQSQLADQLAMRAQLTNAGAATATPAAAAAASLAGPANLSSLSNAKTEGTMATPIKDKQNQGQKGEQTVSGDGQSGGKTTAAGSANANSAAAAKLLERQNPENGSLRRKSALPALTNAPGSAQQQPRPAQMIKGMGGSMGGVSSAPPTAPAASSSNPSPLVIKQQQQARNPPPEQQQPPIGSAGRRASVATPELIGGHRQLARRTSTLTGAGRMSASQAARALTRKQSIVTFYAPGPMYSHVHGTSFGGPNQGGSLQQHYSNLQQHQQQLRQVANQQRLVSEKMRRCSMATTGLQQQQQQPFIQQQQQQQQHQLQQHVIGHNATELNDLMLINQSPQRLSGSGGNQSINNSRAGSRAGSRATSRGSSQHSLNGSGSGSDLNNQHNQPDTLMIPIPPDQMHLRRLSDQSNLVRRSSIIADTLDVLAMSRHRSHSNIDTSLPFSPYLYQHSNDFGPTTMQAGQYMTGHRPSYIYSDENLNSQHQQQAYTQGGFYSQVNPQVDHQQQHPVATADANLQMSSTMQQQQQLYFTQQHQQQQQAAQSQLDSQSTIGPTPGASATAPKTNQQMSSIITPYSQKLSKSTGVYAGAGQPGSAATNDDDLRYHSDSSSDINEDDPANDISKVLQMEGNDQIPSEYFAAPRALSSAEYSTNNQQLSSIYDQHLQQQQQQQQHQIHGQQLIQPDHAQSRRSSSAAASSAHSMAIPSVSVSEFRSNQQRLINNQSLMNQQQQQQQQQYHQDQLNAQHEQIIATSMQINVATEEAIEEQRRRQSLMMAPGTNDGLLGFRTGDVRRGSSGRALPIIPGSDQSRSLLELSHHQPINTAAGIGTSKPSALKNGSRGGESRSNSIDHLNLPGLGHVRRASAPESQNIKIVVDDIDTNGVHLPRANGVYAKNNLHQANGYTGGDLLERVVLYRDDTMDPSTNMTRGFGLRVMGGKIVPNSGAINHPTAAGVDGAGGTEKLESVVTWVLPAGPADKAGIKEGDQIIEWDGKCLLYMSYEQVAEVIESSANIAELLIRSSSNGLQDNSMRSIRRLSQQTEKDIRRSSQAGLQQRDAQANEATYFDPINNMYRQHAAPMALNGANQSQQQDNSRQQRYDNETSYLTNPALQIRRMSERSGTGRQLPQIPGLVIKSDQQAMVNLNPSMFSGHRHSMSSSTGELDTSPEFSYQQQNQHHQHQDNSMLNMQQHNYNQSNQLSFMNPSNYQSRSTGELDYQHQPYLNGNGSMGGNPDLHITSHMNNNNNINNNINNINQESRMQHQRLLAGSPNKEEILALIGLQVSVDDRQCELRISVLSVMNINLNLNHSYYVRIGILPETAELKPCITQVSADLNWKETFVYQNFPINQMNRMAFEIALWPWLDNQLTTEPAQPICGTMISVQSAREKNTDFWPLRALINSNQLRRKSLNDLIENQNRQFQVNYEINNPKSAHYDLQNKLDYSQLSKQKVQLKQNHAEYNVPDNYLANDLTSGKQQVFNNNGDPSIQQQQPQQQLQYTAYDTDKHQSLMTASQRMMGLGNLGDGMAVGRSSMHRNSFQDVAGHNPLSSSQLLGHQPRRASDEVARYTANRRLSGNRLNSKTNCNDQRRSKSVINVNNQNIIAAQQLLNIQRQQLQKQRVNQSDIQIDKEAKAEANLELNKQPVVNSSQNQELSQRLHKNSKQSSIDNITRPASSAGQAAPKLQKQSSRASLIRRRSSIVGQQLGTLKTAGVAGEEAQDTTTKQVPPDQEDVAKVTMMKTALNKANINKAPNYPLNDIKFSTPQAYLVASPSVASPTSAEARGRKRAASSTQLGRKDSLANITLRKLTRNMSFTKQSTTPPAVSTSGGLSGKNSNSNSTLDKNNKSSKSRRKSSSSSAASLETQLKHEDKAVTKRVLARDCNVGQLKLSLLVSKGHLELEVICAQDLRLVRDPSLGVYVKVYIKGERNKVRSHKKKTRVVYGRTDCFQFKQFIKYDASLVDNRILEISLWQKQGGLKSKIPLGTTEIVLANLDLARLQTSWYNLKPHDVVDNSSVEE